MPGPALPPAAPPSSPSGGIPGEGGRGAAAAGGGRWDRPAAAPPRPAPGPTSLRRPSLSPPSPPRGGAARAGAVGAGCVRPPRCRRCWARSGKVHVRSGWNHFLPPPPGPRLPPPLGPGQRPRAGAPQVSAAAAPRPRRAGGREGSGCGEGAGGDGGSSPSRQRSSVITPRFPGGGLGSARLSRRGGLGVRGGGRGCWVPPARGSGAGGIGLGPAVFSSLARTWKIGLLLEKPR